MARSDETVALGSSAFCPLFTTKELEGYEYYHDLFVSPLWALDSSDTACRAFHYSYGFGSPISAAMGIGWVQERMCTPSMGFKLSRSPAVVSRLTQEPIAATNSSTNSTITSDPSLFPLDQSIYVDASRCPVRNRSRLLIRRQVTTRTSRPFW